MIRILVAEDHALVREGLRALIETEQDMELVGEAANGVKAVEMARTLRPDVILLDLTMPRKGGIEAIGDITRENPCAHILVLTSYGDDDQAFLALRAGARSYILKDALPAELLRAIRDMAAREPWPSPPVAPGLAHGAD